MKKEKLFFTLIGCCIACIASAQTIIADKHLNIEVNDALQTKVNATLINASPLTNTFSSSEYLVTKYFTAKLFTLDKKEKENINDAAGAGTEWTFYGTDNINHIEKILSI